jgi:hypothetical protein
VRQDRSVYRRLPGLVQGRSVYLLASLLLLIAIEPWLTNVVGRGLWEVLFTLITLSSMYVLSVKRGRGADRRASCTGLVVSGVIEST